MTPTEQILSKLPDAKRSGTGWTARCPSHSDNGPSLNIHEADSGACLLHCFAGCSAEEITEALGLRLADLMPEGSNGNGHARPAGERSPRTPARKAAPPAKPPQTFDGYTEALAALKPDRVWEYIARDGEHLGSTLRWDRPTGKTVRPLAKQADGRWALTSMPEGRPLLYLAELLARPDAPVFVVEGEGCADCARGIGLLATTSSGGSSAPHLTDWSPLANRKVYALPDCDPAGEKYAQTVAATAAGLGATARILRLPDLSEKGDIVDFLNVRDGAEPPALLAEIMALAESAELVEPEQQPAPGILPFAPFPVDVLPEPVRGFVARAARAMLCDSSCVAVPMLAGLASAIGNTRRIQLKRGWTEPAIVWVAVVADSGHTKSPALELALSPVQKRQVRKMRAFEAAHAEWERQQERHERDKAHWRKSKGDAGDPPEAPVKPVCERSWCDDTTIEALAVLLKQNWRGLLLMKDELSGWLGNFDRYSAGGKGGDVGKWLQVFGGRSIVVDRRGDPPTLSVPRAAVSVAGCIPPETLARALGAEYRENGLAARLLLTCPPWQQKRWTDHDIDPADERVIGELFEQLYGLEAGADDEGELAPRVVRMTAGAKAVYVTFFNEHGIEQAELSGDLARAWSKLEGYAPRLALVLHFARWAGGDPSLENVDAVDEVSMRAGVALARWFGYEARRAYAILGESDEDRGARKLVELIQRKGGTMTARALQQSSRQHCTADKADAALAELVKAGFGRWADRGPTDKGGRPSRAFVLNTAFPVYETPENPSNLGGSVDCRHVDSPDSENGDGRERGAI